MFRQASNAGEQRDTGRAEAKQGNRRFVFGSSTPRSLDLNSVILGHQSGKQNNALVFSASPIRASPDDDPSTGDSRRRPVSAYISDEYPTSSFANETTNRQITPLTYADISRDNFIYRSALYSEQAKACLTMNDSSQYFNPFNGYVNSATDDSVMSQSLVSLNGVSRGRRRHQELTPVMPRERDFTSSTPRISRETSVKSGLNGECGPRPPPKRAVSMTRLDQLSKPRRRYLEESVKALNSGNTNHLTSAHASGKAKSMCNLTNNTNNSRVRAISPNRSTSRRGMYQSMTRLYSRRANHSVNSDSMSKSVDNDKPSLTNISFRETNKQLSKSMVHLSAKPPPRQTRTSKLRTETTSLRNAKSSLTLNDVSHQQISPTRPVSSMSVSTESKESVKMRAKPSIPRKPRPVSIGCVSTERKIDMREPTTTTIKERGSRLTDKRQSSQPTPALRSSRARSAGASPRQLSLASPDSDTNGTAVSPKPAPPRKPAHLKAASMAKKAAKQTESVERQPTNDQKGNKNDATLNVKNSSNRRENDDHVSLGYVSDERNDSNVPIVPLVEPKQVESGVQIPNSESGDSLMPSAAKKEISEDEYKKMLAEKRKQAREQAEREAELERQRIEREREEEVERQRREEEEQRRLEEEQLRLLEEQKRSEEERLMRAMEEVRIREEEESKRREEEARARFEKEEKERKAKEEAERQRLELEERLKKDEEERLARKKKLEAIMSRTRKTTANTKNGSPSNSPNETPEPELNDSNGSSPEKAREQVNNYQNLLKNDLNDEQLLINLKF